MCFKIVENAYVISIAKDLLHIISAMVLGQHIEEFFWFTEGFSPGTPDADTFAQVGTGSVIVLTIKRLDVREYDFLRTDLGLCFHENRRARGALNFMPRIVRNFDRIKSERNRNFERSIPLHRMDDLDIRIIKELGSPSSPQWNVRETYSNIARRIGADEETVRRRLRKAEKLGSLPGWKMMINPHLIGCEAGCIDIEVADEVEKEVAISKIKKVDGVVKILDFRGKGLQITLYYESNDALRGKTNLIQSITRSISEPTMWELRFPRSEIKMKKTDWKIIEAMLDDPRKNLEFVSRSAGVSARTVERRLTLMSEGRTVYLQGIPIFENVAGLGCVFLVHCPQSEKKKVIDELVLSKIQRIELANTTDKQYSTFVTIFDNLSEADEFILWVRGLEGVTSVKMGIMRKLIVVQDWMRDKVRECSSL
jgi:DNA-binding Lrp family transcriptional regulator